MIELTAKEIAEFDQGYTASMDMLVELIASWRHVCEVEADVPEPIRITALAKHLLHQWDTAQLSSALAVAVVALNEVLPGLLCEDCGNPLCALLRAGK